MTIGSRAPVGIDGSNGHEIALTTRNLAVKTPRLKEKGKSVCHRRCKKRVRVRFTRSDGDGAGCRDILRSDDFEIDTGRAACFSSALRNRCCDRARC